MNSLCVVCHTPCDRRDERVDFFGCKHCAHIKCLPKDLDEYERCVQCVSASSSFVGEPVPDGAVDYFLQPGSRSRFFTSEEEKLLKKKVPVKQLLSTHGLGMAHFLKQGLTIGHFFNYGYNWKDHLQHFPSIGAAADWDEPEKWARMKLNMEGVGFTASCIRDYPDLVSLPAVMASLKIPNGRKIEFVRDVLKLEFPEGEGLTCNFDDKGFTALNCKQMGLSFQDLQALGMEYIEQYDRLFESLSKSQVKELKQYFDPKGIMARGLPSIRPPSPEVRHREEEEEPIVATRMRVRSAIPKPVANTAPSPIEAPEEDPHYAAYLKEKERLRKLLSN